MEHILEIRVKKNNKYVLVETLENIEDDLIIEGLINEGFFDRLLDAAGDMGYEIAASLTDNATAEIGGVILGLGRIRKNLGQIYDTIKESNKLFQKINLNNLTESDEMKLQEIQRDLRIDIIDVLQGIIRALPASVVGSGINIGLAAIENISDVSGMDVFGHIIEKLALAYSKILNFLEEHKNEGGLTGFITSLVFNVLTGQTLGVRIVTLDYRIHGSPPLALLAAGIRRMGEIDELLGRKGREVVKSIYDLKSMPSVIDVPYVDVENNLLSY